MLTVSHYNLATVESSYINALNIAEAGVNYEMRKISRDVTTADQAGMSTPRGAVYSFGGGTFRVYCANRDGTTPWVSPNPLYIYSVGTINGVSRTVRVAAKGNSSGISLPGSYVLFGVQEGIINGSPTTVNGDVGTNGFCTFNGHPTITGKVIFNGPGSNWQSPPNGCYDVNYQSQPVVWPSVTQIANQACSGGLTWLASHNDNALATPAIANNFVLTNGTTLTLKGKAGGANYYVTSLTCNGNDKIAFDNSAGPITLWMGPSGSSSTFVFNGGQAAVKYSQDSTKAVQIYVATNNDVIFNGNIELDAGVYNYNSASSGRVILNGSPVVNGCVIGNKFTCNGNPTITYLSNIFQTGGTTYYGFDNSWLEINGINQ